MRLVRALLGVTVSTTDDLRKALAEDDGSLPERWNPNDEPGTSLIGTFQRYETIVTEFGESNIAVIEDEDDGTVWGVALFRTVLRKRFETIQPQAGDTVGVKYVGFVEPRAKGSNGYHNYVVRIIRNSANGQTGLAADARSGVNAPDRGGDDDLPF